MRKISISMTGELDDALESIAFAQALNKSRVIEHYLREHKVVQHYIDIARAEPSTGVFTVSRKAIRDLRGKSVPTAKASS